MHKFVVRKGLEILTYTDFESIPEDFDYLIEFSPDIPPPPHSDEQHEEIHIWNERMTKLLEIEHARRSKIR